MFGGGVGWPELVIVLVIVLVIFGAKRLPEIGKSLGSGMREFKDSITGKSHDDEPPAPASSRPQVTSGEDPDRV